MSQIPSFWAETSAEIKIENSTVKKFCFAILSQSIYDYYYSPDPATISNIKLKRKTDKIIKEAKNWLTDLTIGEVVDGIPDVTLTWACTCLNIDPAYIARKVKELPREMFQNTKKAA